MPARFKPGTALNACEKRSVDLVQSPSAMNSVLCAVSALLGTLSWKLPTSQSEPGCGFQTHTHTHPTTHTHTHTHTTTRHHTTHTHTHTHNINTAYSVQRLDTGWKVRGSNPSGGSDCFLRHIRQDRPTAHPDYCTIRNGAFSPRVKQPGPEADHPPRSGAEAKHELQHSCTPPLCAKQCMLRGDLYRY